MKIMILLSVLFFCGLHVNADSSNEASVADSQYSTPDASKTFWLIDEKAVWLSVAKSEVIVIATADISASDGQRILATQAGEYIEMPLIGINVLKGNVTGHDARLCFYVQKKPYTETFGARFASLLAAGETPSVFFLASSSADGFSSGGVSKFYLAGDLPVRVATDEFTEKIRTEVLTQKQNMKSVDFANIGKQFPLYQEVRALLDDACTNNIAPHAAVTKLCELGLDAVPALICLMDDRRKIAAESVRIMNPPGHFEMFRLYDPKEVWELADIVLNHFTSFSFQSAQTGSDAQRRHVVNGWRIFLLHMMRDMEQAKKIRKPLLFFDSSRKQELVNPADNSGDNA